MRIVLYAKKYFTFSRKALKVNLHSFLVERWLSGRKRTTRNRLTGNRPWVRIPPSPFNSLDQ